MHRYRDIDPNIRMACIQSLGVWILAYPSLFLQDLYLKYLGWTLNDKVSYLILEYLPNVYRSYSPSMWKHLQYFFVILLVQNAGVRKVSVLALQNLYEVGDNVPTLGLFTERFSNRMIELADDIDVSVAVCAIGLVKLLLR